MNNKTTYELTITDKLQRLPLPDMEDAIWARVKAQLDLDLPTGDDGGGGPDAPTGSGWTWGAGLGLFVAAFVAIFFLRKNDLQRPASPSTPTPTVQTTISPSPQPVNEREQAGNPSRGAPFPARMKQSPPGATFISPPADSLATAAPTGLPLLDSQPATAVVLPPPVPADTSRPKPKTRGVRGLTDDDYRIVPAKRDSS